MAMRLMKRGPRPTTVIQPDDRPATERFNEICYRYRPVVARWAKHYIPDPEEAGDLIARVMQRARMLGTRGALATSFGTWFFRLFREIYHQEYPGFYGELLVV